MSDISPDKKDWLKKEVEDWKEKKIISIYQGNRILNNYSNDKKNIEKTENSANTSSKDEDDSTSAIKVLSIIGAIILGLGVILFVSANWQKIPDHIKTLLLLTITFITFYLGYYFSYVRKDLPNLGRTLLFLACLFYGGSIFLIAQIYHVNTDAHWLMLLWAGSILPVAYFFNSTPTYLLASSLFVIWDRTYSFSNDLPNYFYPLIVFLILIPLAKKEEYNIPSLVGMAVSTLAAIATKEHWLVLAWFIGTFIWHLFKRKETYIIISAVLSIFWSISFTIANEGVANYFYIIPALMLFHLAYKLKSDATFAITLIGTIIWINMLVFKLSTGTPDMIDWLLLQLFIGVVLHITGIFHKYLGKKSFSDMLKMIGFGITIFFIYLLSFKSINENLGASDFNAYFYSTITLAIIALVILISNLLNNSFKTKDSKIELGIIISGFIIGLIVLFGYDLIVFNTIITNIVLFFIAIATVIYGFDSKNLLIFNFGIIIFVVQIISRYFGLLWDLLPRSLFFIIGGLILLLGSVVLEKKRSKTIKEIKESNKELK